MRRLIVLAALIACGTWAAASFLDPGVKAGTAIRFDIAEMATRSDLVLEGRIMDAYTFEGETGLIETEYLLSVDRTLWGADLGSRTVRLPGGVLPNGNGMMIPGMPNMAVGEDVLLFLSRQTSWGMRMPMGLAQGKFSIVSSFNGDRRLVRDQGSMTFIDASTGELSETATAASLDYAAAISEIHAAVAQRQNQAQPAQATDED